MSDFEILTYRQIADRMGISPESARKKVRRRGWRVIPGNRVSDPVRVYVPTEDLAAGRPAIEDEDDAAPMPADSELLSTLKALEGYVSRVSGNQERLLGEIGRLLSDLAAKDAEHAAALERVREEERERYREDLADITAAHEQARTERLEEINRLVADIERERTGRTEEGSRYQAELDRQWQAFLEERERYFEDLERERMATAKAEARAYRSEAATSELRSALVTVVPKVAGLLKPAESETGKTGSGGAPRNRGDQDKADREKADQDRADRPAAPRSMLKGPAAPADDDPPPLGPIRTGDDDSEGRRSRLWWLWKRR